MVEEILKIWDGGGWVMIPLFILAAVLYAHACQLILYVRRVHLRASGEMSWWDWIREPHKADDRVRSIIEYTQDGVTSSDHVRKRFDEIRLGLVSLLERRTLFVAMLVAAAPLLGLLGTVLGMLQTFFGISTSGGAEASGVVAAGISEALITTQAGLTIALPGLFVVMLIQRKKKLLEAQIARLESLTLSHLQLD